MNTKKTEPKSSRADIVKRLVAPAALWIVNRVLDFPPVKAKSALLQKDFDRRKLSALKSLRKSARTAARNPAWLAASATAFALGIGLMAKAARAK